MSPKEEVQGARQPALTSQGAPPRQSPSPEQGGFCGWVGGQPLAEPRRRLRPRNPPGQLTSPPGPTPELSPDPSAWGPPGPTLPET